MTVFVHVRSLPLFPVLLKIHQPPGIHRHCYFIVDQKVKSERFKC